LRMRRNEITRLLHRLGLKRGPRLICTQNDPVDVEGTPCEEHGGCEPGYAVGTDNHEPLVRRFVEHMRDSGMQG